MITSLNANGIAMIAFPVSVVPRGAKVSSTEPLRYSHPLSVSLYQFRPLEYHCLCMAGLTFFLFFFFHHLPHIHLWVLFLLLHWHTIITGTALESCLGVYFEGWEHSWPAWLGYRGIKHYSLHVQYAKTKKFPSRICLLARPASWFFRMLSA